ncbi:farnesyl diphosphate synthase [Zwartia sp.]|uniref:polyprenyl synthetase family protein n=1 Tax=Zwartia sp. TaxID=2978004 RepID=UPI0027180295|nr:farnesyl diphosphate synthase [Zwartia sp.]MDO9023915.1 polyprenyl synthetase family protein [Zwartia sp.]
MSTAAVSFTSWLSARALHIESVLGQSMPQADVVPCRLHEAMRYAVLGGGKRVRAALVYAAGAACSAERSETSTDLSRALDCAAAAVELVHAYSLVHDDLPCMDDDILRRGRPTVHVQFDEATALLAGDALQPLAFELLVQMPVDNSLIVAATQVLARAAGSLGMAGGQAIDLASVGQILSQESMQQMHMLKTGALLSASVELGGLAAGASTLQRQALSAYGRAMGLAFQVVDDMLDVTTDTSTLGKTAGKDAAANKPTYVALMGLDRARAFATELHREALEAIAPLGQSSQLLAGLANFIVLRDY